MSKVDKLKFEERKQRQQGYISILNHVSVLQIHEKTELNKKYNCSGPLAFKS